MVVASLQDQLEPRTGTNGEVSEPARLLLDLESEQHLHRDAGLGRIFHLGGISFRESRPADALHVSVHANRIAAHVDKVSPIGPDSDDSPRYSLRGAVAHNLAGMAHDLVRLVRGRQGDHRSKLDCEWVPDGGEREPQPSDLLDPKAGLWSVQLEARVAGRLDETRLRTSLVAVLGSPAARPELLKAVACRDDGELNAARSEFYGDPPTYGESPPLRACLARHPDGDLLMLNLNHAAADGFGALPVLDRIARAYAGQPIEPVDFLATENVPVRPASAPISPVTRLYKRSVERIRDAFAQPARLSPDGEVPEDGYGFHQVVVDVDGPDATANVLLAALHLAIGDWNAEHDAPGGQIGVLVPVNLRPEDWPEACVGNFSVTARVSSRTRHRSTPARALAAVTGQTARNRRNRTGVALIAALRRANLVAFWASQSQVVLQPLTGNRVVDTALLSHLGGLERPPGFGPDAGKTRDLWFSAPARVPQALCLGSVVVGARLHLTFRYPHRLFGAEAAARFAQCYLRNLPLLGDAN